MDGNKQPRVNNERRPVNTNNEANIYTSEPINTINNSGTNINSQSQVYNTSATANAENSTNINDKQYQPLNSTGHSHSPVRGQNRSSALKQKQNGTNATNGWSNEQTNGYAYSRSPTKVEYAGPKIIKRELWWKEQPSNKSIPLSQPMRLDNVSARVDDRNSNYNPNKDKETSRVLIESRKLEWNAEPAIDTWSNIKHQPQGKISRNFSKNLS
jgi:hypothetical protein